MTGYEKLLFWMVGCIFVWNVIDGLVLRSMIDKLEKILKKLGEE